MSRGIQLRKKRAARNSDTFYYSLLSSSVRRPCEKLMLEWESTRHCSFLCALHEHTTHMGTKNDRRPTIAVEEKFYFPPLSFFCFCAACARRVVRVGRWRSHIAPCSSRVVESVKAKVKRCEHSHTPHTRSNFYELQFFSLLLSFIQFTFIQIFIFHRFALTSFFFCSLFGIFFCCARLLWKAAKKNEWR